MNIDELFKSDIVDDFEDDYKIENIKETVPFYLRELDGNIELTKRETFIIAAGSGVGKTVFSVNSAVKQAQKGHKVLFISMEMPKIKIMEKVLAILIFQEEWKVRLERNKGKDEEAFRIHKEFLLQALKKVQKTLKIIDGKYRINELKSIIKRADEEGYEVCYLDNYQILTAGMTHEQIVSISEEIREAVQKTKGLAFVHLSQVTKETGAKKDDPTRFNIRNGQKLKDDASGVIYLYRKNDPESKTPKVLDNMFVYVDKNRYGKSFFESELYYEATRQVIGDIKKRGEEEKIDVFAQTIQLEMDAEKEIRRKKEKEAEDIFQAAFSDFWK